VSNKLATVFALAIALAGMLAVAHPGVAATAPKCTIVGTPGKDYLHGTAARDVICGRGGADEIAGGPGNDRISGGPGNDMLRGGGGRDRLFGGPGRDTCVDRASSVRSSCESGGHDIPPAPPFPPPCCKIEPAEDLEPPLAEWVTVGPRYVDTNSPDPSASVGIESTDESGIASVVVEIVGPGGLWKTVTVPGAEGTRTSTNVTFPVPPSTPHGVYRIESATFTDRAGNSRRLDAQAVADLSPWYRFTAYAGPDEVGPELTDFEIGPTEVAPGAGGVGLTVAAGDALSGIVDITASIATPDWGAGPEIVHSKEWKLASGTPFDGSWQRQLPLPVGATEGYYRVLSLHLHDGAGNTHSYSKYELDEAGFETEFLLAAGADTTPPEILGFSLDRTTVDPAADEEIEVQIHVRDDLSGFAEKPFKEPSDISLEIDPDFPSEWGVGWGGRGLVLESGSLLDGTWSRTVRLEDAAPSGTYGLEIWAEDRAGNRTTLTAAQLEAKGWPHSFTVL